MAERWLQTPHLPQKKITLAAVSEKAHSVRRALVSLDIRCLPVPCCRDLAGPVASHADYAAAPPGKTTGFYWHRAMRAFAEGWNEKKGQSSCFPVIGAVLST